VAVSTADEPLHIAVPAPALTAGVGFTLIVNVALFVHPDRLLPVTVYTVVARGLAVAADAVVDDNPAAGVHV